MSLDKKINWTKCPHCAGSTICSCDECIAKAQWGISGPPRLMDLIISKLNQGNKFNALFLRSGDKVICSFCDGFGKVDKEQVKGIQWQNQAAGLMSKDPRMHLTVVHTKENQKTKRINNLLSTSFLILICYWLYKLIIELLNTDNLLFAKTMIDNIPRIIGILFLGSLTVFIRIGKIGFYYKKD